MLASELYNALDPDLSAARDRSAALCHQYNNLVGQPGRFEILKDLLGKVGDECFILPPFRCDYGKYISVGNRVFMNFGCVILDCAKITIGNDVLFGPNVSLFGATHPLDASVRRNWGPEYGLPISIGDDVWIGGNVTVCPGVTIGNRSVVGAASVVTKDVPDDVVVAGNPAKIIRRLEPKVTTQTP
ncbi:maltose O-acetyltransferase [Gaertneriomyces semiglobifer]|nr:maltose O-acetyltransferase [Gaertneriomyces semiglobifer]